MATATKKAAKKVAGGKGGKGAGKSGKGGGDGGGKSAGKSGKGSGSGGKGVGGKGATKKSARSAPRSAVKSSGGVEVKLPPREEIVAALNSAVSRVDGRRDAALSAASNGLVTKADEYRRVVSSELSDAYRKLSRANARYESLKAETKGAKGDVEAAQCEVNDLVSELRDIEHGQYQPHLFGGGGAGAPVATAAPAASAPASTSASASTPASTSHAPPADEGGSLPIAKLSEFGPLSEADIEKLANCPAHPQNIGEFEAWMKRDPLWMNKIDGFGEAKITKLQDAHLELRLTYPIPDPDDIPSEPEMERASDVAAVAAVAAATVNDSEKTGDSANAAASGGDKPGEGAGEDDASVTGTAPDEVAAASGDEEDEDEDGDDEDEDGDDGDDDDDQ
jgi:hypothetical protein